MEEEETKSEWSVSEPLAVTVLETSGDHRVDILRKRDHRVYYPPSCSYHPRNSVNGKSSDVCNPYEIGGRICIPGKIQARGRKEKTYKMAVHTETGT